MKAADTKLHRALHKIVSVFSRALADSSEVNLALRRIRQEGYTLRLVLDRGEEGAQIELAAQLPPEPSFLLDGRDVAFLKSVGIDATRPARRRRS